MKRKLIALTICTSLIITPLTNAAEPKDHPNESIQRRIGFFLLHGICFVGGLATSIKNRDSAITYIYLKSLSPEDEEEFRTTVRNGIIEETGCNQDTADEATNTVIENYQKKGPIHCGLWASGFAATIYGLQGLVKDFRNLFNRNN